MNPDGVRQQADSFHAASGSLSEVVGSWGNMFDPNDLGTDYHPQAQAIVDGFGHVIDAVQRWSGACAAFGDALTNSANSVQYTDTQFSNDISKVSFDGAGDLTSGGK
jgi:hypothetical protein